MTFERFTEGEAEATSPTLGNDPIVLIEAYRQQANAMGAIDSEHNDFDTIIVDLQNAKISPEEAVARAALVRDSKQSYH